MNVKKYILTAGVMTIAISSTIAFADNNDGDMRRDRGLMGVYSQLDLSEAQQAEIKAKMQALAEQRDDKRAQMEEQRQALEALITSAELDQAALNTITQQIGEQTAENMAAMAIARHEIWQSLTPEQQEKAQALREEMQANGGRISRDEFGRHGEPRDGNQGPRHEDCDK